MGFTVISDVLGYVSMSEEADTGLLKLAGEHSSLCDWKDCGYTIKNKMYLVWHNIS